MTGYDLKKSLIIPWVFLGCPDESNIPVYSEQLILSKNNCLTVHKFYKKMEEKNEFKQKDRKDRGSIISNWDDYVFGRHGFLQTYYI